MDIIICGGRDYTNAELVDRVICALHPDVTVVTGGARGTDRLAHQLAERHGRSTCVHQADWSHYGKGAGVIRNTEMLDHHVVTLVIAFPGGKGTANMVMQAKDRGIPVMEVSE